MSIVEVCCWLILMGEGRGGGGSGGLDHALRLQGAPGFWLGCVCGVTGRDANATLPLAAMVVLTGQRWLDPQQLLLDLANSAWRSAHPLPTAPFGLCPRRLLPLGQSPCHTSNRDGESGIGSR